MDKIIRYTFFDVETPNTRNNSICQIGIIYVVDGRIKQKLNILVNPEDDFEPFNSGLHGITKHLVKDKPNFKTVWGDISKYFNEVLVAHNASFDLNVLSKCLVKYDIDLPLFSYICTYQLAKSLFSSTYNGKYSLDQLCKYYNIDMIEHHDAYSDVLSCYYLFNKLLDNFKFDSSKYIKMKRPTYADYEYKDRLAEPQLRKSINNFYGLVIGITADLTINNIEIRALEKWVDENKEYIHLFPFNQIIEKIEMIVLDQIITSDEMASLVELVNSYTQSKVFSNDTLMLMVLQGIITGITVDNKINKSEIDALYHWLENNQHLAGNYPFDKVFSLVKEVISDGILTESELNDLTCLFIQFIDPVKEIKKDQIYFEEKTFCLTGEFEIGPKSLVEELIQNKGGCVCKSVIKKLDYLIVGGVGSDRWSFDNYGGKVKKALEFQQVGSTVLIINEKDFFDHIHKMV